MQCSAEVRCLCLANYFSNDHFSWSLAFWRTCKEKNSIIVSHFRKHKQTRTNFFASTIKWSETSETVPCFAFKTRRWDCRATKCSKLQPNFFCVNNLMLGIFKSGEFVRRNVQVLCWSQASADQSPLYSSSTHTKNSLKPNTRGEPQKNSCWSLFHWRLLPLHITSSEFWENGHRATTNFSNTLTNHLQTPWADVQS